MAQFPINRYRYIGRGGVRYEVFARTPTFADNLIARLNKISDYKLRRKIFFFATKMVTDTPPYEVELEQENEMNRLEEEYGKNKASNKPN